MPVANECLVPREPREASSLASGFTPPPPALRGGGDL